ncbi:amidohydrolase family protein [Alteromonas oceanisediminis]|uniref:amidohydrolase family protein n=1 Tax=Alteromonas oceanisediminis TaxID=2836180 RepID=UPI001BD98B17|nr:amidohydrolase family protein [Alteromonas oceanisediminis]MBT0587650.1 amidohydrolase family protein [Alteromonas oceanisediminis]
MTTLKKILLTVGIVIVVMTGLSALALNYESNQYWGAHTDEVDASAFARPQAPLAIMNANVLSADGETFLSDQMVLIENGHITAVAEHIDLPSHIQRIDAEGQFVIPGLTDSHVHLWQSPNDLMLYLANGVTHVKELNGSEEHLQWKADIAGGRPGPDLFVATRRHNSHGVYAGWFHRWTAKMNPVHDVDDIAEHVSSIKAQGFDAIKIYTHLTKPHFEAFDQQARLQQVKLLGHIPSALTLEDVWHSELNELAHIEELVKALDREFGGYTRHNTDEFLAFVARRSDAVAQQLASSQMAVMTTVSLIETFAEQKASVEAALKTVELPYVNPGIAESTFPSIRVMGWLPDVNIYRLPENYPDDKVAGNQRYWQAYATANHILLRAMNTHGVKIMAGTDANVPVMVPGFSMHQELMSLNRAGLTTAQALRSATATPADWMGIKSGRVKPGYQADIVILNANPLDDIRNTGSIASVISNGRYYDRDTLNAMLKAVKEANQHSRTKPIAHLH